MVHLMHWNSFHKMLSLRGMMDRLRDRDSVWPQGGWLWLKGAVQPLGVVTYGTLRIWWWEPRCLKTAPVMCISGLWPTP